MFDRIVRNLKTSIVGVATGIVAFYFVFTGDQLDQQIVEGVLGAIVLLLGLFARD